MEKKKKDNNNKKKKEQNKRERGGKGRGRSRGCVQTKEWRMRAMVVPLADRFSTAHHGKTVDATMLYFPCFFLLSLSLSLCSTNRRMTRTVTKGHDGGRISRFLIKRPVPLGYHGHAWHAIRVIAFDPRTRFPELFGCDRGKSGHSMLPSFLGERFGYYGHHQAEKSRDN